MSLIQRGYADFRMSVIPWKGHYLGVAKEDEFVGPATFVMSAPGSVDRLRRDPDNDHARPT